jgi:hypothetical protein
LSLAPSPTRTIALTSGGLLPWWGNCQAKWPLAPVGTSLDYSLSFAAALADTGDAIATAALSVAPSGAGELLASDLCVTGSLVTVTLAPSFPGRDYLVMVRVTSNLGRVWDVLPQLTVSRVLGAYPPADAPTDGFGPAITWPAIYSGLKLSGVAVFLTDLTGWPISTAGLAPGAAWANGTFVNIVPGFVPALTANPLMHGVTALTLRTIGGTGLPTIDPQIAEQYWLNGTQVVRSLGPYTGVRLDGVALTLINPAGYPTSSDGLPPGAVWANGIFINAVAGATPRPIFPVFFGPATAADLLAYGASILPVIDPEEIGQLWLNGVQVCISGG